jgi:hypothetical protein
MQSAAEIMNLGNVGAQIGGIADDLMKAYDRYSDAKQAEEQAKTGYEEEFDAALSQLNKKDYAEDQRKSIARNKASMAYAKWTTAKSELYAAEKHLNKCKVAKWSMTMQIQLFTAD